MEIGQALYTYRKKLGLTQGAMAAGIITVSYYSKVEKGSHRISAENLFAILASHSIDIQEFMDLIRPDLDQSQYSFKDFDQRITDAYFNNQLDVLIELAVSLQLAKGLPANLKQVLEAKLILCQYLLTDKPEELKETSKIFIKDKIFSTSDWDDLSLALFANSLVLYDLESNHWIINNILSKKLRRFTKKQRNIILTVLINFIGVCIYHSEYNLANYYIRQAQKEAARTDNFFQKLVLEFYRLLLSSQNMESSSLEDDMVSILHALSLAGLDSYAQRLKDFWEEMIDRSVLESFDV